MGAADNVIGCSGMGSGGGTMPKGGCPIGAKTPPMTGTGGATAGAGACTGFLPFFFWSASNDWRWACNNFCILAICSFMAAVWALVFFLVVEGGGFWGLSASAMVRGSGCYSLGWVFAARGRTAGCTAAAFAGVLLAVVFCFLVVPCSACKERCAVSLVVDIDC